MAEASRHKQEPSFSDEPSFPRRWLMEEPKSPKSKFRVFGWILLAVILLLGILYYFNLIPTSLWPPFKTGTNYQAVFLTNGQVYFGKLFREDSRYPILRDVYYLQVTQPPQPLQAGQVPPTNINLVKLGGELHGPTDEMRINRDQILFIEDLKPDSQVLAAIRQSKASQ